jgi:hypothetical protein
MERAYSIGTPTIGRRKFAASERVSEAEKLKRQTRCSCFDALASLETTTTAEELRRVRLAMGTEEDKSDLRDGMEIVWLVGWRTGFIGLAKKSTVRDRPASLQSGSVQYSAGVTLTEKKNQFTDL